MYALKDKKSNLYAWASDMYRVVPPELQPLDYVWDEFYPMTLLTFENKIQAKTQLLYIEDHKYKGWGLDDWDLEIVELPKE